MIVATSQCKFYIAFQLQTLEEILIIMASGQFVVLLHILAAAPADMIMAVSPDAI
jgi:hypothetical protein